MARRRASSRPSTCDPARRGARDCADGRPQPGRRSGLASLAV